MQPILCVIDISSLERSRRASIVQISPLVLENFETTFTCSAGYGNCDNETQVMWLLDGTNILNISEVIASVRQTDGGVDCAGRVETKSTVGLVLTRDHSGSVLQCEVKGVEPVGTSFTIEDVKGIKISCLAFQNTLLGQKRVSGFWSLRASPFWFSFLLLL